MESVTAGLTGGYRIYLAQEGKKFIVLFGGGTKKSQQSDIYPAQELYQEYKRQKKEAIEQKEREAENKKIKKRSTRPSDIFQIQAHINRDSKTLMS